MSTPNRPSSEGSFPREVGTQTGKAVILIVVAVVIAVVLLHHGSSPATATKSTSKTSATLSVPSTTTTTVSLIPPAQVKLLVLNGTGSGSLAGEFTTKLKGSPGYQTLQPDNTTSTVPASTVYAVTAQYTAEAKALATSLGLPPGDVVTTLPANAPVASAEKTIADLILVVGPDLASKA